MSDERTFPHNLDAERAVLGAVLIQNNAMDTIVSLPPSAFYRKAHEQIFAAMLDLHATGVAIDFTILRNKLHQKGELEAVGGPAYLASLVDGLPHATNIDHYANIVREKASLRHCMKLASQLLAAASDEDRSALDIVAETDAALMNLAAAHLSGDLTPAATMMHALFPIIEEAYHTKRAITGLQTGWRELDELTLGLHPGKLIYLAARTSQGKSAMSLNIAVDVAKQGHTVALFSLEDSTEDIAMRMAAAESGVSLFRMRSGYLVERDWTPISNAMSTIASSGLHVDDSAKLSVQELRAKCRRLASARGGLALVIVDYVQQMYAPGKHANRAIELGVISKGLKQVAKELRVPVLAAAQLNRESDKEERRPRLTDLRESGSLEQDADLVWLIYRPDNAEHEGLTELLVAKQRNGPTGTIKLRFLKEQVKFVDWVENEKPARQREFSV